jgi:hypothetical protein
MKVRIKLLGMLGLFSVFKDKENHVDLNGSTLKDLLDHLFSKMKLKGRRIILNQQGEISPELLVFLNGKPLYDSNRLNQQLRKGDLIELAVFSG